MRFSNDFTLHFHKKTKTNTHSNTTVKFDPISSRSSGTETKNNKVSNKNNKKIQQLFYSLQTSQ